MPTSSTSRGVGSPHKVFAPVGHCIYCESTEDLTDEHIVPYGLGGNYILPKSSCRKCARETGRVEQFVLRKMFGSARARTNLQSRTGKPEKLTAKLVDQEGASRVIEVDRADYPDHLVLMNFAPPGIIVGREPTDMFTGKMWGFQFGDDEEIAQRVKKMDAVLFESRPFDAFQFSRMLAKIALAFAYAAPRLEPFHPLLPDLVLGRDKTPSHLVGCLTEPPEPQPTITHQLDLKTCEIKDPNAAPRRLLLCRIRLFAALGTPEYHVVVGEFISHDAVA